MGDATVFGGTAFFNRPNFFFSHPDEYILADKAYRITRRCMTPYKEPLASCLIGRFREFNARFTEARVIVEHAFQVLKTPLAFTTRAANLHSNKVRSCEGIELDYSLYCCT